MTAPNPRPPVLGTRAATAPAPHPALRPAVLGTRLRTAGAGPGAGTDTGTGAGAEPRPDTPAGRRPGAANGTPPALDDAPSAQRADTPIAAPGAAAPDTADPSARTTTRRAARPPTGPEPAPGPAHADLRAGTSAPAPGAPAPDAADPGAPASRAWARAQGAPSDARRTPPDPADTGSVPGSHRPDPPHGLAADPGSTGRWAGAAVTPPRTADPGAPAGRARAGTGTEAGAGAGAGAGSGSGSGSDADADADAGAYVPAAHITPQGPAAAASSNRWGGDTGGRAPVLRGGRARRGEAAAESAGARGSVGPARAAGNGEPSRPAVRAAYGGGTAGSGTAGSGTATGATADRGTGRTGRTPRRTTHSGVAASTTTNSATTPGETGRPPGQAPYGGGTAAGTTTDTGTGTGGAGGTPSRGTYSSRTASAVAGSEAASGEWAGVHGEAAERTAGSRAGDGDGSGGGRPYAAGAGGDAGAGRREPRGGPGAWGAGALVGGDCAAALAGVGVAGRGLGAAGAAVLVAALLAAHHRGGLYRPALVPSALAELPALAGRAAAAWCLAAAVTAADGTGVLGWAPLLTAVAVTASAACLLRALVHARRRAAARRAPAPTLVVGGGPDAERLVAVLRAHPEYGLRPVAVVPPGFDNAAPPRPRTGSESTAPAARVPLAAPGGGGHSQHAVRHVLVLTAGGPAADATAADTTAAGTRAADATAALLAARGCRVWHVTMDPAAAPAQAAPAHAAPAHGTRGSVPPPAGHLWGFTCTPVPARRAALGAAYGTRALCDTRTPHGLRAPCPTRTPRAKRAMDAALAALALLVLAPVLGTCALAVRLADGPGVLFRQERIGLGGRPFTLLKFRTLRPGNARESATRWSIAGDRRMSAVGRILRRTSLDELPQLWNVLRGDMSMVGPRPERPYFVERFSAEHPGYADRHRMPAGITGLAQVHGLRGDTSIADRARFDNHYIDTWSLWQDVTILVRTACTVFRFGGS